MSDYFHRQEMQKRFTAGYSQESRPNEVSDRAWTIYLAVVSTNESFSSIAKRHSLVAQRVRQIAIKVDMKVGWAIKKRRRQESKSSPTSSQPINIMNRELCAFEQLSIQTRNTLVRGGVSTLADLCQLTKDDLFCIRRFGDGAFREVVSFLDKLGLSLKVSPQIDRSRLSKQENSLTRDSFDVHAYRVFKIYMTEFVGLRVPDVPSEDWQVYLSFYSSDSTLGDLATGCGLTVSKIKLILKRVHRSVLVDMEITRLKKEFMSPCVLVKKSLDQRWRLTSDLLSRKQVSYNLKALSEMSRRDLLAISGIGTNAVTVIELILSRHGLTLRFAP